MSARTNAALFALLASSAACAQAVGGDDEDLGRAEMAMQDEGPQPFIPNDKQLKHPNGFVATYSTLGRLDMSNPFNVPQGDNGRSCSTCHVASAGWSIRPDQVQEMFNKTGGQHPIFNVLDANNQNDPRAVSANPADRRQAYSMLLNKALFRRGSTPAAATREFDIVAADDPFGWGSLTRISVWRRSMPTTNFHTHAVTGTGEIGPIGWDLGSATLFAQAENNIRTGQHGPPASTIPGDPLVVQAMVDFEASFATANVVLPGVGELTACGGRGGTAVLAQQARVNAPFDLYTNWLTANCSNAKRKSIARGEVLFNTRARATGGTCRGCHNAQNSGSNINGTLFDIGASDARWRTADMPLYTLKNRATGEEIQTTDPGRANRTGRWADINRFKTPSLRGVSSHAPYFHNGICDDLPCVVKFYEESLGFNFTPSEEEDLVAFLRAL